MTVKVVKRWIDETPDARPESLTIRLVRNGKLTDQTVTLNKANGWKNAFTDLAEKDGEGNSYRYTVVEERVPEGYAVTYAYRYETVLRELTATVTNKKTDRDDVTLTGRKVWDDAGDEMSKRPVSVVFDIHADEQLIDSKLLNSDNGWSWSGVYPAKDADGNKISYYITERTVPWYETQYSDDKLSAVNSLATLTLTNTEINGSKDRLFDYTIALTDASQVLYNGTLIAELNGKKEAITFRDGKASVQLKDGDKLILYGVHEGSHYSIEQAEVKGYVTWVLDKDNTLGNNKLRANEPSSWIDRDLFPEKTIAVKTLRNGRADFYNDVGIRINGLKTIDGQTPDESLEGAFTFVLKDAGGAQLAETTNGEKGKFHFDIRRGETGTLDFTITEKAPEELGDLYMTDLTPHTVSVKITDTGDEGQPIYTVDP